MKENHAEKWLNLKKILEKFSRIFNVRFENFWRNSRNCEKIEKTLGDGILTQNRKTVKKLQKALKMRWKNFDIFINRYYRKFLKKFPDFPIKFGKIVRNHSKNFQKNHKMFWNDFVEISGENLKKIFKVSL